MPSGLEITQRALEDFKKIQEYMCLAKKENATETYAKLKKEYQRSEEHTSELQSQR